MNKIYSVICFLIFAVFVIPAQAEDYSSYFTVYGQVNDTNGITPLNGINVTITILGVSMNTVTTTGTLLNGSLVDGYYYFPTLPVGAPNGTIMTLTASTTGKSASTSVAKAATEPQKVDLTLSTGGGGTTTSGGNGGSGGGGGGGGGGSSGEKFSNIQARESREEMVAKDLSAKYTFRTLEIPVYEVVIIGNLNLGLVNTQIEILKDISTLVNKTPPGTVYQNLNIWVGTSGIATPKNIKEATIKFKVETSWIDSNNFKDTDIALMRWDGTKWYPLETLVKTKDGKNTYFEGKTNAFSPFAITSLKGTAIETPIPAVTVTGTPPKPIATEEPTPAPTKKTSGFEVVFAIVAVLVLFVSMRKRR